MADKLKVKKQGVLPPVATRDLLAELVYIFLQTDGWLQDGSADEQRERDARRKLAVQAVIEWAIAEGVVREEDVIPF